MPFWRAEIYTSLGRRQRYGMNTVGVFNLPLMGGQETMAVDLVQLDSFGDWTVTKEGLYFIHRYDGLGKPAAHLSIDFFNFATRRTITVMPLKQDPTSNPGLNVSLMVAGSFTATMIIATLISTW